MVDVRAELATCSSVTCLEMLELIFPAKAKRIILNNTEILKGAGLLFFYFYLLHQQPKGPCVSFCTTCSL